MAPPHVCRPRWQIVPSVAITVQDDLDPHGSVQGGGRLVKLTIFGEVGQRGDFSVVKDHIGGQFGRVVSEPGEGEQRPGDDGLDGEGAFQPLSLVMMEELGPTSGLEDAVPLFDAPSLTILVQDPPGVLGRGNTLAGQQGPAEGRRSLGRGLLDGAEEGHGDGLGRTAVLVSGRRDRDEAVAQGQDGRPRAT